MVCNIIANYFHKHTILLVISMTKFDELKQRYNLHSTYTKLTKAQEHALIKELRNDNTEE
ncbi:hypothetical protein FACS1894166_08320 [Bacilli bacterium]|nr:hypothetical protein FACS1894166_08320 [Bacilli bacterium]